jgi:hypothetical protein
MQFLRRHKCASWVFIAFVCALLVGEELCFGYGLGVWHVPCEFFGGKHALTEHRCVTRTCYWLHDCGRWVYPGVWRDRISPGDSIAKTIFWLGEPGGFFGSTYSWPYGKGGSGRHFAAVFDDGRFVEWHEDVKVQVTKGE